MFVSAVCSTGDLCFYHKNAIIVPMITLKFGSFTDIKSVFFLKKNNFKSCFNTCIYCETSQQNTTQKTYICASEDVLLLINIHNLLFLFSGQIMSL